MNPFYGTGIDYRTYHLRDMSTIVLRALGSTDECSLGRILKNFREQKMTFKFRSEDYVSVLSFLHEFRNLANNRVNEETAMDSFQYFLGEPASHHLQRGSSPRTLRTTSTSVFLRTRRYFTLSSSRTPPPTTIMPRPTPSSATSR